jgi:hypothetical protein
VRDILDVWPALPLIVQTGQSLSSGTDNIIAALGQSNRVCKINLRLVGWESEAVLAAMQVPFPELTDLAVEAYIVIDVPIVMPDSLFGGSAPRLRSFELTGVTFPELPKLHLFAPHLVHLTISRIHESSSEVVVALLPSLSSLTTFSLEFDSLRSGRDRETQRPPPSKRSLIPALTSFDFKGDIEYLENLVTFIDAPRLNSFLITFIDRTDLRVNTPRLAQFITCTPKLRALDEAHVQFEDEIASIGYRTSESGSDNLLIDIWCLDPDWLLSCIEQVCTSLHPCPTVEDLYIEHQSEIVWDEAIGSTLWLEFFVPFTAVKNLYICKVFAPGIADALQELVEGRITEVLPSLENIFVEELGPGFLQDIGQFVAARQLSGHTIVVSAWVSDNDGG